MERLGGGIAGSVGGENRSILPNESVFYSVNFVLLTSL